MAIRNDTILQGLNQERDRLLEALKPVDTTKLKAELAAVERVIAIYQPRVTESSKTKLPKILKAVAKIRGNEHGNGHQPKLTQGQQRAYNIVTMLRDPNNGNKKGMASYINHGYLTRNTNGEYVITAKGKRKLAELTKSTDAQTDATNAGD